MAGKRTNYIEMMEQQRGVGKDWITTVTPEDIQRAGKRIVRDMVKGFIDYEKQGYVFLDSKFLDNLIIVCENEFETNSLYYKALDYYNHACGMQQSIGLHVNHFYSLVYIYSTVVNRLYQVKLNNNIAFLSDLSAILYSYRNHLNN